LLTLPIDLKSELRKDLCSLIVDLLTLSKSVEFGWFGFW